MMRRFLILFVFAFLIITLKWGTVVLSVPPDFASTYPISFSSGQSGPFFQKEVLRRDLLEILDRIVVYENYYHSVYGQFTPSLDRIGLAIPKPISRQFLIRVAEATASKLLVTAGSMGTDSPKEMASLDQSFHLEANFPIPEPRPEYLRFKAIKHLRNLRNLSQGQYVEEEGLYRGFFHYEIKTDSKNHVIGVASGVRSPVFGMQLELGKEFEEGESSLLTDLFLDFREEEDKVDKNQSDSSDVLPFSERWILARKIFRGELGREAKSWSELSRVAQFHFEDQASKFLLLMKDELMHRKIASMEAEPEKVTKDNTVPTEVQSSGDLVIERIGD